MGVHAGRHLSQAGDDRRIPGVEEASGHFSARVDRLAFGNDQTYAAASALLVVSGQVVRRHTLKTAERGEMRLKHRAVTKCDAADGKRREQMRESRAPWNIARGYAHFLSFPFARPNLIDYVG